jgi:hypothetical protein
MAFTCLRLPARPVRSFPTPSSAGPTVPAGGAGAPSSVRQPAGAAGGERPAGTPHPGRSRRTGLGSGVRFADDHDRPAFSAPRDASVGPPPVQVVRPSIALPAKLSSSEGCAIEGAPPGPPSGRRGQNRQGQGGRKKAGQATSALSATALPVQAPTLRAGTRLS